MAADGDLDSSKAKSTSTQGECSREQLKTVPSSLEGFQQRWGQRWMMSLSPVQEMCWVVRRPTDAVQLMRGACTLARCFGFSSWFLFSWFMQRKGAQRHDPGRVGIGWDVCAALAGLSCVCGEKRGVIPAGTKQQSQQPKSRR